MDREAVKTVLRGQEIELPSWAFGNSGTRFKVFPQPGFPDTAAAGALFLVFQVAVDDVVLDDGGQAGVAAGMVSFWTWRPC